jgi:hypothetical protein
MEKETYAWKDLGNLPISKVLTREGDGPVYITNLCNWCLFTLYTL